MYVTKKQTNETRNISQMAALEHSGPCKNDKLVFVKALDVIDYWLLMW